MNFIELAQNVIDGHVITRDEALAIVESDDDDFLTVMQAAFVVRNHFHGRRVKVHVLRNAKSGVCPEDCKFCSQSLKYNAESDVPKYKMQEADDLVEGARKAVEMGAVTYCMVTATRGPSSNEMTQVSEAARRIKEEFPQLRLCASLGLLKDGQAESLREAGIDRYNHNLEASPRYFPEIATTHTIEDRMNTVRKAKAAGMEACCGGLIGMGEERHDWVDLAMALRELEVESVPLNFLDPRPGTPLGVKERVAPRDCLRALAMFRFVHPEADLRVAGGREVTLRTMQPLALYAANSLFTNGYLTTPGAEPSQDWQMIHEAGFEPDVIEA